MKAIERLLRWANTGDDPDIKYCAGNSDFAADVGALLRAHAELGQALLKIKHQSSEDHIRAHAHKALLKAGEP